MKKKDLYVYLNALNEVKDLKGVKFAYATLKNKKIFEEEIKIFEEIIKPLPKFEEYEHKRIGVCENHCETDENNKPIIIGDRYKIKDEKVFNKDLDSLKNEYDDVLIERMKQIEDYNKMLNEDTNLNITKISFDDLPTDISPKELESIEFMIELD